MKPTVRRKTLVKAHAVLIMTEKDSFVCGRTARVIETNRK